MGDRAPARAAGLEAAAATLTEAAGEASLLSGDGPRAIPEARGVLLLEDRDGAPLMLACGARLRTLARKRLREGSASSLAGVAARARWRLTASGLGADLAFLDEARRRSPSVHEVVTDRWQGWFVRGDPGAEFPTWEKIATRRLGRLEADPALTLGPFADKHAAGRAMQSLDGLFELCRYPDELRRAPDGRACAYKEMGRCPAACDGSETMDAYRARVGEAVRFVALGVEGTVARREREMAQAAGRLEYERAERLRRWLDEAASMTGRGMRWARSLADFRFLLLARAGAAGWAHVARIEGGSVRSVGAITADTPAEALGEALRRTPPLERVAADEESCSIIGLVAAWLYASATERRGGVALVRVEPGEDPTDEAVRAARRVLRAEPDDETPDHTLDLA